LPDRLPISDPARAEILRRDANLNTDINQDKGDLSGHYGQLKSEDNSIRHQEQVDAARNGGHLTWAVNQ